MLSIISFLRPLATVLGVLITTLSFNIFGALLWLFVRLWNRPLYRIILGRFALTRWIETTTWMLPPTRYVLHGDPTNLHMAQQASLVALAAGENPAALAAAAHEEQHNRHAQLEKEKHKRKEELLGAAAEDGVANAAKKGKGSVVKEANEHDDEHHQHHDQKDLHRHDHDQDVHQKEHNSEKHQKDRQTTTAAAAVPSPLSIMICNHQVDLDWLYLWDVCRVSNSHSTIKVILKDTLKYIPMLGFAMSLLEFLFLKRDWESDRSNLQRRLASFRRDQVPVLLIIFPEGTTVNTRAMEKSQAFSREKQRPHLEHLLLPRTTGFEACVNSLGKGTHTIYDVTMAFSGYSGEIPTYEMGYERARDKEIPNAGKVLLGHKAEVHVDVRAISTTEILNNHDSIEKWLDERWVRKERLLKYFAQHQKFPEEEVGPARTVVLSGKFSSLLELWSVVLFSVIILPFALMMSIPYALIVALSYSYIKWHEYTRFMLSREEHQDYRKNVKTTVLKTVAFLFLFFTILAWSYSIYSVVVNLIYPKLSAFFA